MVALCGECCHPTLQHHNNYNRTNNYRHWNAVGSPDDGHKDARKHVEIILITNKSLFVASSWFLLYLLKIARWITMTRPHHTRLLEQETPLKC